MHGRPIPGRRQFQHRARGVVRARAPADRRRRPFDHAGEDRFHPRAIARLLAEPPSDLLHGFVQRPGDGAQLVVSEAEVRRRELAATIAVGDAGDETHAFADAR
jgi:hypothetical protein